MTGHKNYRIGDAAECLHALIRGGHPEDEQIGALLLADAVAKVLRSKR